MEYANPNVTIDPVYKQKHIGPYQSLADTFTCLHPKYNLRLMSYIFFRSLCRHSPPRNDVSRWRDRAVLRARGRPLGASHQHSLETTKSVYELGEYGDMAIRTTAGSERWGCWASYWPGWESYVAGNDGIVCYASLDRTRLLEKENNYVVKYKKWLLLKSCVAYLSAFDVQLNKSGKKLENIVQNSSISRIPSWWNDFQHNVCLISRPFFTIYQSKIV